MDWLDDGPWSAELRELSRSPVGVERAEGAPTYGELARVGTALVDQLSRQGRWDAAASQARHLKGYFALTGLGLGPIAEQTFDGLLAAALARDADELVDFVELVAEMFP